MTHILCFGFFFISTCRTFFFFYTCNARASEVRCAICNICCLPRDRQKERKEIHHVTCVIDLLLFESCKNIGVREEEDDDRVQAGKDEKIPLDISLLFFFFLSPISSIASSCAMRSPEAVSFSLAHTGASLVFLLSHSTLLTRLPKHTPFSFLPFLLIFLFLVYSFVST